MTDAIATAEATLCRIFGDVLGLDVVHPEDGFFEVGGDSVLGLQVVARAREAGLAVTVRNLFDNQTPETLAAVAGDIQAAASGSGTTAAAPPLLTFADEELEELEDTEIGSQADGTEAEWETVT
jgi:aryl carrier-like protein